MYEGLNASLWKPATGRLMWMSHPSWPSMVWQIYGWDYQPNASFYGIKKACEPIHVQMNLPDYTVLVSNTTTQPLHDVRVKAQVFDLSGKPVSSNEATLDVPANDVARSFVVNAVSDQTVRFVKLQLSDARGNLLSENFYWQAAANADYQALNQLPKAGLKATASSKSVEGRPVVEVKLKNPTDHVVLMAFLTLRNKKDGSRILPAYASDNYVNLLPGEERSLTIEAPTAANAALNLSLEGWNVTPATFDVN